MSRTADPERSLGPTRAEEIRRRLADEIVRGLRAPGTPLDEAELAALFGVSRTPVREALRQLEVEGFATSRPRRGALVSTIAPAALAEMFFVMAELEALCCRLAAQAMTAEEGAELERARRLCEAAVAADAIEEYREANDRFHDLIYRASHNGFLMEQTRAVRRRVAPFRRAQFQSSGRLAKSLAEHERIAASLRARDGETAAREVRAHIFTVEYAYYHQKAQGPAS
ncbi:transcriptional regulator, GntR family [Methylobacterium sp. 4-46]|uniref:GntR family transcriptional regulator n=1 Tax=unclassified Methylobacterium TaxID=2615210 RepID=UPI000165C656|nr:MULTISPECIES: GntR family transcriptional regulator [Methylobacterium]ACA17703.1 transcriptional regulator, GntR family [Methylobacterium sp. 4-46]WFT83372.1 GntR family transcriptional regulator [Methylobacterium nodulans]